MMIKRIILLIITLTFVATFFVLTDIFLFPALFTRIYPKPFFLRGVLFINPFFVSADISNLSKKMGVTVDKKMKLEVEFVDKIEIGFFRMGETGIDYKCQKTSGVNKVLIVLNQDKFDNNSQLQLITVII